MKKFLAAAAVAVLACTPAFADDKPSDAEVSKIKAALAAWGCEGGEMEKETEATSVYEVDDANCKGGQYDVKLDKDYNVLSFTRD